MRRPVPGDLVSIYMGLGLRTCIGIVVSADPRADAWDPVSVLWSDGHAARLEKVQRARIVTELEASGDCDG